MLFAKLRRHRVKNKFMMKLQLQLQLTLTETVREVMNALLLIGQQV